MLIIIDYKFQDNLKYTYNKFLQSENEQMICKILNWLICKIFTYRKFTYKSVKAKAKYILILKTVHGLIPVKSKS